MRIFLAGIMQGSHVGAILQNQDYRRHLRALCARYLPQAEVYDPLADHGQSLEYDDEMGRSVFFFHNRLAAESEVVIAYIPEATMGTAIEMWQAHQQGRMVISISPLRHNWVVRFLSHAIYEDFGAFEAALADGTLAQRMIEVLGHGLLPPAG